MNRFIAVLGIIPDMILTDVGYAPTNPLMKFYIEQFSTGWLPARTAFYCNSLDLQLRTNTVFDESVTLVPSFGIEIWNCFLG